LLHPRSHKILFYLYGGTHFFGLVLVHDRIWICLLVMDNIMWYEVVF
jgi:hypothetical protein